MISLLPSQVRDVLILGAHCDDVEIGCGGMLSTLARRFPEARVRVVLFSGDAVRSAETRTAIATLAPIAGCSVEVLEFRDGFFPVDWSAIKQRFETLKGQCNPDLVFTHYEHDRHQDHRTICELTWNTFRNHLVLEYEIPKYDGDLGRPNTYIALDADIVKLKLDTLRSSFPSQQSKRWFTDDLFSGLMRIRGMECNAASGFAEAFYARKVPLAF